MDDRNNAEPPKWRFVHFCEYSEPLNLIGKDVFSIVGWPKEEVAKIVGKIVAKGEMQTEEMPGENLISSTGGFADEVHEWPNATLGPEFKHLVLQFQDGRLIHMQWRYQSAPSLRGKSWWKV